MNVWEENLHVLVCKPGPCAPELFLCLCGGVTKPTCSDGHVPLQSGWSCCSFVIKVKVTCWAGQGSGTGIVSCLMSGTGTVLTVGAFLVTPPSHLMGVTQGSQVLWEYFAS